MYTPLEFAKETGFKTVEAYERWLEANGIDPKKPENLNKENAQLINSHRACHCVLE